MPPLLPTSSSEDSSRDSGSNQDTEASTGSGVNEDGLDNEDRPVTEPKKNEESQPKRQSALEQEEEPSSDEDPDSTYDTESHEYIVQQASQLSASGLYQSYLEKLRRKAENSTKKKDQGSKLVKNFIDYVRVLEERIGHLESKALAGEAPKSSEVLSPESTKSESPEDKAEVGEELVEKSEVTGKWADVAHETRFFHADNELNSDGVYNYLNPSRKDTYTSTDDSKHVLRVLYDWAEDLSQVPSCRPSDEQPKPEQIDLLEISVTSEPIASFFRKRFDLENLNRPSLVRIAKPFRPLLRNLDPLREQLAKLEKSFGSEDGKQASNRSKDSEEGQHIQQPHERDAADDDLPFAPGSEQEHTEVEAFDCQEALPHFHLLLTLVDNYLAKQISLLNVMKSGQHEKIAFENLWMLFDTGDTIYCPSRDGGLVLQNDEDESHTTKRRDVPQAYQVVATDGGTPQRKAFARKPKDMVLDVARFRLLPENDSSRKRDALPAEGMKHKYIPLFVYCFYIDYDGIKYGTVTEIFVFKPYEGVVDIQTLEAYPLQYLEAKKPSYCVPANLMTGHAGDLPILQKEHDKQDIDFLLERGRKFIDMTAVSHMHMTYEGLTVGESREEVNSPVIVDFRLAFTEYKQLFQNSESIVPTFSPLTGYWNSIKHTRVSEFTRDPMCNCCPSSDAWATEQRSRREKVEKKVKMTLEDFEFEKSSSSYEGFKHYLEASNLIKLLPGTM
ncbi:hypothetical protein BKA65DRAFT_601356 [Rhexocercosporidium sp. MPI-PUGE-AT-0058]|nr:hypothetical protein BKA65DRAFT_601356 [Rhexocercosporidium sp. MPI-PUGE-AT-0058]